MGLSGRLRVKLSQSSQLCDCMEGTKGPRSNMDHLRDCVGSSPCDRTGDQQAKIFHYSDF